MKGLASDAWIDDEEMFIDVWQAMREALEYRVVLRLRQVAVETVQRWSDTMDLG